VYVGGGTTRDRETGDGGDDNTEPYVVGGAGALLPSGAIRPALPMPLGSYSTLGLAGPAGMPEVAELPAPAEPAGGICAKAQDARGPADIKEIAMAHASTEMRDIKVSPKPDRER
jgi:hypothetical protein